MGNFFCWQQPGLNASTCCSTSNSGTRYAITIERQYPWEGFSPWQKPAGMAKPTLSRRRERTVEVYECSTRLRVAQILLGASVTIAQEFPLVPREVKETYS
jgi:hypothetical protein